MGTVEFTNNLLARMRSNMHPLSNKMRIAAEYIIENANEVQYQTITELAKNTKTSEATVLRLCRDLGYKGYSDFRMALAVDLSQSPSVQKQFSQEDTCEISAQRAITSLIDTAKLIDRKALNRVCELVINSKFIHCVGVGASSIVSRYLAFRLIRIGKKVVMYEDTHLAAMSADQSSADDLWFAISSSGSTREVLHAVTQARTHQVPVIAITNINHSPLTALCDEMLVAARPEGPLTGGAFSSKVGALLIVDVLINTLIEMQPKYQQSVLETAEVVLPLLK